MQLGTLLLVALFSCCAGLNVCEYSRCVGCSQSGGCYSDSTCFVNSCDDGFYSVSTVVSYNCGPDGGATQQTGLCVNTRNPQFDSPAYAQCWAVNLAGDCILCPDTTCYSVMAPTASATLTRGVTASKTSSAFPTARATLTSSVSHSAKPTRSPSASLSATPTLSTTSTLSLGSSPSVTPSVSSTAVWCAASGCTGCQGNGNSPARNASCATDATCITCDDGYVFIASDAIVSSCLGVGLCVAASNPSVGNGVAFSQCWAVDTAGDCILCFDSTCDTVSSASPTASGSATLSIGASPSVSQSPSSISSTSTTASATLSTGAAPSRTTSPTASQNYCFAAACIGCAVCFDDLTCAQCASGFVPPNRSIVAEACQGTLCVNADSANADDDAYENCWAVDLAGDCIVCLDTTCAAVTTVSPSATISFGASPSVTPTTSLTRSPTATASASASAAFCSANRCVGCSTPMGWCNPDTTCSVCDPGYQHLSDTIVEGYGVAYWYYDSYVALNCEGSLCINLANPNVGSNAYAACWVRAERGETLE